jgi:hypothetical protein
LIRAKSLIWFDAIAGLMAGLFMFALSRFLIEFYQFPPRLYTTIAFFNLAYGCTSLVIALTSRGDRVPLLRVIAVANLLWTFCCFTLAVIWFRHASPFGIAQLLGEGHFVGVLGIVEWRTGRGKEQ